MIDLVRLCRMCEGGMGAPVWPDGGALIDQPRKLVEAFNFIRSLYAFYERQR